MEVVSSVERAAMVRSSEVADDDRRCCTRRVDWFCN